MPESISANAKWDYDYIAHYRLDKKIIEGYLSRKWGDYKYFVKASSLQIRKQEPSLLADLASAA